MERTKVFLDMMHLWSCYSLWKHNIEADKLPNRRDLTRTRQKVPSLFLIAFFTALKTPLKQNPLLLTRPKKAQLRTKGVNGLATGSYPTQASFSSVCKWVAVNHLWTSRGTHCWQYFRMIPWWFRSMLTCHPNTFDGLLWYGIWYGLPIKQ